MSMIYERENDRIRINIPNKEAWSFASGIWGKDSTVTGFYTSDNEENKKTLVDFFKEDFRYELDVENTLNVIEKIKSSFYSKFCYLYKDNFSGLDKSYEYFKKLSVKKLEIPRMFFAGSNGRYLKFDNENEIVQALRHILYGEITGMYIYKDSQSYVVSPFVAENALENLIKRKKQIVGNVFNRNVIVFGAPGTGKSYKLNENLRLLQEICSNQDKELNSERVTFHPDYTYSNFVGTYKPVMRNEEIKYEFVPGPFIRCYIEAIKNNNNISVLVIEEINRANVAAVFGDIFQLLDRNSNFESEYGVNTTEDVKRYLFEKLGGSLEDYAVLKIPENMYIWATMNSADQGVFPMDTAFKRRWNFEYLGINNGEDVIKNKDIIFNNNQRVEWNKLRKAINNKLIQLNINEDKLIGPFFLKIPVGKYEDKELIDNELFVNMFKNKVIMYLFEDAAKQKRKRLFKLNDENIQFSKLCDMLDRIGIEIFDDEIVDKVNEENIVFEEEK